MYLSLNDCAQETIVAFLLARDGSMAAVHLPPALLSMSLQTLGTGASTADLTAAPVDLSGCVYDPGCPALHGCMGCSMEYLPSMGLLVASLTTMGADGESWMLSGRPVSGVSALSDITVSQQSIIQVGPPYTPTGGGGNCSQPECSADNSGSTSEPRSQWDGI